VQRFVADENFDLRIIRILRQRIPDLDVVEAQAAGLRALHDTVVLAWAADAGRVLLTHDQDTMLGYAHARLLAGVALPGLVYVPWDLPIARAVEDLVLLIQASRDDEWEYRVHYLPL